jgi:hypothetical protein
MRVRLLDERDFYHEEHKEHHEGSEEESLALRAKR